MKSSVYRIFWSLAIILISFLALMGPGPVQADSTVWVGGDGSWFTEANWDNGVPGSALDAFIDNGGTATIISGEDGAAQNLTFGTSSGMSGTVTQTGGALTISGTTPGLMLGSQSGGSGYYNLEGGSLDTQTVAIGNYGYGEFVQKADTIHTAATGLNLGQFGGGEGKYTLEGGTLTTAQEQIGLSGTRTFIQTGGSHTVTGTAPGLIMGSQIGGSGYYTLEGGSLSLSGWLFVGGQGTGSFSMEDGTLTSAQETIGNLGTGTFTQTGGTHIVSGTEPGLMLGSQSGAQGYFTLEGGSLDTQIVVVGNLGSGEILQKAGTTHSVATRMVLGQMSGSEGKYTLEGGSLSLASEARLWVGVAGTGTFTQSGGSLSLGSGAGLNVGVGYSGGAAGSGTFTQTGGSVTWSPSDTVVNFLMLGANSGTGSYYLQGDATLTLGGNAQVGGTDGTNGGYGFFYQSGGTFTNTKSDASGRVLVGYHDGSQGTYELSGGRLSADRVVVGYSGTGNPYDGTGQGTFTVSGGRLEAGTLIVGGANSGTGFGKLDLTNTSAEVVVSTLLQFGALGQLSAAPGATIHMTGSEFQNTSTTAASLAGLSNLTLSFEGTGSWDPFEVAGTDLGASMEGFTNNFALGTLKLGAGNWLQLVDASDNNGASDDEALYVYNLELDSGAILDLNGLHLYYLNLTNLGGSFENGSPQAVPLPGAVWLLGFGLLGLAGWRKKLRR